jgi:glycosyltransferase involved in cell wall biosynthesis
MRILHLFSNSKWTGPAEPALNLCVALRNNGIDVDFACAPKAGSGFNKIVAVAREQGIVPLDFMRLYKHRNPVWNYLDARALRRHLSDHKYDLVHCHLDNDHDIAVHAAVPAGIPVVRSNHFGAGLPTDRRHRMLVASTAALIEPSLLALKEDAYHFQFPTDRLFVVPGAVDTIRFSPARSLPDMREQAGIPKDAFVLGIVARMQTHRHYEDLFEAFHKFAVEAKDAHLVVVGRGTRQEQVGFAPVQRLGLEGRVHFSGYLEADHYIGMLQCFDVGLFLTPGTDGTCRAARELMAMGKPMIVADRGMLREIVTNNEDGIVTDGSVTQLYEAFLKLYLNAELRHTLASKASATAHSRYTLDYQAACVTAVYDQILRQPVNT